MTACCLPVCEIKSLNTYARIFMRVVSLSLEMKIYFSHYEIILIISFCYITYSHFIQYSSPTRTSHAVITEICQIAAETRRIFIQPTFCSILAVFAVIPCFRKLWSLSRMKSNDVRNCRRDPIFLSFPFVCLSRELELF